MSNLKNLRTRIKSIKATTKITKAMQLVAAAKLTKIKRELGEASHYLDAISNIVHNIASTTSVEDLPEHLYQYFAKQTGNVILVIFTSEKGLCGSFNASVIRNAKSDIERFLKEQKTVNLIIIGNKGYNVLKNQYPDLIKAHFTGNTPYNELFGEVKNKIVEILDGKTMSECHLYFNKFKNAMMQFFTRTRLLPVATPDGLDNKPITYEYETLDAPTAEEQFSRSGSYIIERVINLYLDSQINYACIETKAGEEGARMTAMDNATKNANEIVENLTLDLNRRRQAIITKDLIEIIAGSESV
jgi:F-type H+-transporting ATPase subunit gamma